MLEIARGLQGDTSSTFIRDRSAGADARCSRCSCCCDCEDRTGEEPCDHGRQWHLAVSQRKRPPDCLSPKESTLVCIQSVLYLGRSEYCVRYRRSAVMSSDDEQELLKELSQELGSIEMSPHVSDDELSVVGMVQAAPAPSAVALKQASSCERASAYGKRQTPDPSTAKHNQVESSAALMCSSSAVASCGHKTVLSPPTSSGQMSPTSVCTATEYGCNVPGNTFPHRSSAVLCQQTGTSAVHSPVSKATCHTPEARADTGAAPPAAPAGRSCSRAQHPAEADATAASRATCETHATSSRSKRPRVRNKATAVRALP